MPKPARSSRSKGRNGAGDTVVVSFDPTDLAERKALEAARLLATKHGRRKQAIVALLSAIYTHYEQTGELLSAADITAALVGQGRAAERPATNIISAAQANTRQRISGTVAQPQGLHKLSSGIESARASASTEKIASNFLRSVSSIASGFFD